MDGFRDEDDEQGQDISLLEDVTICTEFPLVKLSRFQYNQIKSVSKGTKQARMLLDMIFTPDQLNGKSFSILERLYPEKINALCGYVLQNTTTEISDLKKTITSKCKGK